MSVCVGLFFFECVLLVHFKRSSLLLQKYVILKSFMIYFYYYDVTSSKKEVASSLSVSCFVFLLRVFLESIFYNHPRVMLKYFDLRKGCCLKGKSYNLDRQLFFYVRLSLFYSSREVYVRSR